MHLVNRQLLCFNLTVFKLLYFNVYLKPHQNRNFCKHLLRSVKLKINIKRNIICKMRYFSDNYLA